MQVLYRGERTAGGCRVYRQEAEDGDGPVLGIFAEGELDARRDLVNHSPTGFEWGYAGSGPAQLALAILADTMHAMLADPEDADRAALGLYQRFKEDWIARLDRSRTGTGDDTWIIAQHQVADWYAQVLP